MSSITFENPSDPEQPRSGVYGWFFESTAGARCLYVGRAGGRLTPNAKPSTLYRGVQELRRSCLSSIRSHMVLDTDFIVGTALIYLKGLGYSCYWKHLSDTPEDEAALRLRLDPLLQPTSTTITRVFRPSKSDRTAWTPADVPLAEKLLFERFRKNFNVAP